MKRLSALLAAIAVTFPLAALATGTCEPDVTGQLVDTIVATIATYDDEPDAMPETCLEPAKAWLVRHYFPDDANARIVEGVSDDKFGFWNPVTNTISMAPLSEFVDTFGERDALMWYVATMAHELEHRSQGRVANGLRIFDVTDASHERIEDFEAHVRRHFKAEGFDTAGFCAR